MAALCHICNKNEALYRCPACSRLICPDCIKSGVCVECYNKYPLPNKSATNPSVSFTVGGDYTGMRVLGAVVGFLTGVFGILIGAVVFATSNREEAKAFGHAMMIWGIISFVIGLMLCFVLGFISSMVPTP